METQIGDKLIYKINNLIDGDDYGNYAGNWRHINGRRHACNTNRLQIIIKYRNGSMENGYNEQYRMISEKCLDNSCKIYYCNCINGRRNGQHHKGQYINGLVTNDYNTQYHINGKQEGRHSDNFSWLPSSCKYGYTNGITDFKIVWFKLDLKKKMKNDQYVVK